MTHVPKCPVHQVEMKLTMRKLPEDQKYYLCLKWGCVHRYRERDGYFTTAYLSNLFRSGKLKT
jgi:hypothetical protein